MATEVVGVPHTDVLARTLRMQLSVLTRKVPRAERALVGVTVAPGPVDVCARRDGLVPPRDPPQGRRPSAPVCGILGQSPWGTLVLHCG